jgi:hypothetical protein
LDDDWTGPSSPLPIFKALYKPMDAYAGYDGL